MEEQNRANGRQLRRFGLTVGGALVLLAAVLFWREQPLWPVFAGTGGLLVGLGLLVPTWLAPVERVWMAVARAMGWVMTRVILGLLFCLIFTPAGLILRLLGKDPLGLRFPIDVPTYWQERTSYDRAPARMEKMF
ncbi:MAG: sxtJ [Candidatus Eisenbacteria sp.]|nr:sxtJ [Candidatus Eisenbacteria bacterium]